jgi:hypothetical protein
MGVPTPGRPYRRVMGEPWPRRRLSPSMADKVRTATVRGTRSPFRTRVNTGTNREKVGTSDGAAPGATESFFRERRESAALLIQLKCRLTIADRRSCGAGLRRIRADPRVRLDGRRAGRAGVGTDDGRPGGWRGRARRQAAQRYAAARRGERPGGRGVPAPRRPVGALRCRGRTAIQTGHAARPGPAARAGVARDRAAATGTDPGPARAGPRPGTTLPNSRHPDSVEVHLAAGSVKPPPPAPAHRADGEPRPVRKRQAMPVAY